MRGTLLPTAGDWPSAGSPRARGERGASTTGGLHHTCSARTQLDALVSGESVQAAVRCYTRTLGNESAWLHPNAPRRGPREASHRPPQRTALYPLAMELQPLRRPTYCCQGSCCTKDTQHCPRRPHRTCGYSGPPRLPPGAGSFPEAGVGTQLIRIRGTNSCSADLFGDMTSCT